MKLSTDSASIKLKAQHALRAIHKYTVPIFLVFLLGIYGFLAFRVFMLEQNEPDPAKISAQLKTAGVPKIDEDVVNKMQQLQDNSVSVQSLFVEARRNPFQE